MPGVYKIPMVRMTEMSDEPPECIEAFLNHKEKIHPDDTFIMVDADSLPPA